MSREKKDVGGRTTTGCGQDVVASVLAYNAGRDPERLAMKLVALRRDAHSFLRGTCHRYTDCLPDHPLLRGGPESAPVAWNCGDMHLENFGSYIGDNGLAYFDINDFDEAALAPVVHDPLRLLTNLFVLTEALDLSRPDAEELARFFIDTYADTLASGKARWVERDTAQGLVRDLLDSARTAGRGKLLANRTELRGTRRRIRLDGVKALPASPEQKAAVTALLADFAAMQVQPGFFKTVDIARRISGNGSLGLERYIILVKGSEAVGGNALLDLKLATPSVLAGAVSTPQPAWQSEAQRIVVAQTQMQAMPAAFLHDLRYGRRRDAPSFVLRIMQPGQDRVDLQRCRGRPKRLGKLLATMAQALAWAQLRACSQHGAAHADVLIAFAQQKPWRTRLIALARPCAAQVEADWQAYAKAFDAGAFAQLGARP